MNIEEAKEEDLEDAAAAVGALVARHGLDRVLAVTRLHNHFPIGADEKIVIARAPTAESIKGFVKDASKVMTLYLGTDFQHKH